MGSSSETKEAKALRLQSQANMDKVKALADQLNIPEIEAQKIVLEQPELVGLEEYVDLGPSQMESIKADQGMVQEQMDMLDALGERAESGATAAEKAERRNLLSSVANQEKSRQAGIMREMAERGQAGGGAELAAMLQSSQSSADRASREASDLAAQMENRALQAMSQKSDLAGQLRSQDMADQQTRASAADRISQMNWQASQDANRRNLDRRQQMANTQTQLANQQQMHNKGLIQQDYQNRLQKLGAQTGAYTSHANMQAQQAAAIPRNTSTLQDIATGVSAVGDLAKGVGSMASGGMFKGQDGGVAGNSNTYKYEDGGVVKKDPTNEKNKKPATKMMSMFAKNEKEARENTLNGEGPTETHKQYEDRVIREDMNRRFSANKFQDGGVVQKFSEGGMPKRTISGDFNKFLDYFRKPEKPEIPLREDGEPDLNAALGFGKMIEAQGAEKMAKAQGGDGSETVHIAPNEKATMASLTNPQRKSDVAPDVNPQGFKEDKPIDKGDTLKGLGEGLSSIGSAFGGEATTGGGDFNFKPVDAYQPQINNKNMAMEMAKTMAPKYEDGGVASRDIAALSKSFDGDIPLSEMKYMDKENRPSEEDLKRDQMMRELTMKKAMESVNSMPDVPNFEDGGLPRYMDGGTALESDSTGEIIPGGSMANDRVDAKLNSGEMVLNVEQQQRLLDLLRGEASEEEVLNNDEEIVMDSDEASPEQLEDFMKMIGLE